MSRTQERSALPDGEWKRMAEGDFDELFRTVSDLKETAKWIQRTLIGALIMATLAMMGVIGSLVIK